MNPLHLLRYVIQEALLCLSAVEPRIDSPAARALLLGTAMTESNLTELQQGGGPAMGLWQVEPRTHKDVWENFLLLTGSLGVAVHELLTGDATPEEMRWNLCYNCAIARIVYWRRPEPLPGMDALEMAEYWKRHYNTKLGAGTVEKAEPHFRSAIRLVASP